MNLTALPFIYIYHKSITISSALADKLALASHALSSHQVESLLADKAAVLLPVKTVFELTDTIDQLVVVLAADAHVVLVLQTSVNRVHASSQLEVRHALGTNAPVVLGTSVFVFLAGASLGDVIAAFA